MGRESTLALLCGGDLGGGRKAGPQFVGRIIEGNDDLEVLRFFRSGGGLRGGHAGGTEKGLVADQGHMPLEDLAGNGVDGHFCGLAHLNIDDIGLVHFDLGGDNAHVRDGHDRGAFCVLNTLDDGFALTERLIGHNSVKGGDGAGQFQHVLLAAQRGPAVPKCPRAESVCALAWLSCATAWATEATSRS